MIERGLMEYLVNALWQLPLLAGGAWLCLWAVRPGPRTQHQLWLGVLGLAVLLPVYGMGRTRVLAMQPRSITASGQESITRESVARNESPTQPMNLHFIFRTSSIPLGATTTHWLVRLYLAILVFALARIARAWYAARLLVKHSREMTLCDRARSAFEDYGRRLEVNLPQLRESAEVTSPMIVGVAAPILLLPEGFARHTEEEIRAALYHELAHIKRRDYLGNALCQLAALPVFWHPVIIYGVQPLLRKTREMVCDAMAAQEMNSELRYAKCLLSLAHSMLGRRGMVTQAQFLGLFGSNILEERVMRLVETRTMSVRARLTRVATGAAVMIAATSVAAIFHVTPMMAQSAGAATEAAHNAPAAAPTRPQDPLPAALPAATPDPQPAPKVHRRVQKNSKQQIVAAQRQASEAAAFVNSPEFKRQIAAAERQATEVMAKVNSPEFKQQIAEAQRQASEAAAFVNSPEFKQRIAAAKRQATEAMAKVNSPEFKRQIAAAQQQAAEAAAFGNSPEFKRQMDDLKKQLRSGELQRLNP